jgi:hypothetical protein
MGVTGDKNALLDPTPAHSFTKKSCFFGEPYWSMQSPHFYLICFLERFFFFIFKLAYPCVHLTRTARHVIIYRAQPGSHIIDQ